MAIQPVQERGPGSGSSANSTGGVYLFYLMIFSLLSSLLALYVFLLHHRARASATIWKKKPSSSTLPPGPPRLPIIGNLHQCLPDPLPHRSLRRLSDRYGPLMYVQLGAVPVLVVSSAEMAQQVLRTHDLAFSDRPPLTAPLRFSYGRRNLAGAPFDEDYAQTRKLVMSTLLGAKKQARMRPIREDEVGVMVSAIADELIISGAGAGGPVLVNVTEMALCLFNNINRRVISGRRLSGYGDHACKSNHLHQMFLEVNDFIPGFSLSDLFPGAAPWLDVLTGRHARMERRFRDVDRFLDGEIDANIDTTTTTTTAESTAGYHYNDEILINSTKYSTTDHLEVDDDANYVRTLLRLRKDPQLRNFLTRDKIKAIILDMYIGGAQSSMASVEWAMAELVMRPEAMKKAQEEVRRVAGSAAKDRIDEDDLPQLHYMKMVLKETWRLHPTGALLIPRQCREDCDDVGGYTIPAKTLMHVNVWAIGRDPGYWGQDSEVFRPERFFRGRHRRHRGLQGPALRADTIRLRPADVPGDGTGGGEAGGRPRQPPPQVRLVSARRAGEARARHGRRIRHLQPEEVTTRAQGNSSSHLAS